MSITITCPSCGKVGFAPETAAGKKAKCRGCGNAVSIPSVGLAAAMAAAPPAPVTSKICTSCGIDVSGQKRTKDTAGRYYCQPCWQAKVAAGAAADVSAGAAPPVQKASVGAKRSSAVATAPKPQAPPMPPALPEDDADGFAALPPPLDDIDDAPAYEECPQCGISFPPGEMVPGDGDRLVCKACARQEVGLAPPPLPAVRSKPVAAVRAAQPPPLQYQPPRKYQQQSSSGSSVHGTRMLIGGIVCTVGVVITVGSYMNAVSTGGGGRYVVAWGAIVFGGFRFFRGLLGKLSDG